MPKEVVTEDILAVTFQAMPELPAESLPSAFEAIREHQHANLQSYGGWVIRKAAPEIVDESLTLLRTTSELGLMYRNESFPLGEDEPLHVDNDGSSNVTVHITRRGQCQAIVLVGSRLITSDMELAETNRLFDDSSLDSRLVTLPAKPLRTTLGVDDILLFDQSQPHAFRSLTRPRFSEAHFLTDRFRAKK